MTIAQQEHKCFGCGRPTDLYWTGRALPRDYHNDDDRGGRFEISLCEQCQLVAQDPGPLHQKVEDEMVRQVTESLTTFEEFAAAVCAALQEDSEYNKRYQIALASGYTTPEMFSRVLSWGFRRSFKEGDTVEDAVRRTNRMMREAEKLCDVFVHLLGLYEREEVRH